MMTHAILGCGRATDGKEGWAIGHAHSSGSRAALSEVRLVGVDPNPENLAAWGDRFGVPLSDRFTSTEALYAALVPDLVSVCTWPALHANQTVEAFEQGVRGVVCEKPAALNQRDLYRMQEAADRTGGVLAIAHQRRYEPVFRLTRRLLPRIGTPVVLEARVGDGWDILSWTVHWFDLAAFLFGGRAERVLAGIHHGATERYHHPVEDASVVFAEWASGDQAIWVTGPNHPSGPMLTLRGPNGFLQVRDADVEVFTREGYELVCPDPALDGEDEGFTALLRSVAAALEGGPRDFPCAAPEGLEATAMAFAVHESALNQACVTLPSRVQYNPLEVARQPAQRDWTAGEVLLVADEHFGSEGREGIRDALAAQGVPVRLHDATQPLTQDVVAGAGVVAMFHTQREADAQTRATLTEWVGKQRPLVLIHASVGAYPEWEDYGKWCGRVWEWGVSHHPYEACTLRYQSDQWPGAWDRAFLPVDEVFADLGNRAPVIDVMEAEIPQGRLPAAWRSVEFPRVGTWIPAHRRDVWGVPALGAGLCEFIRQVAQGG